MTEKWLFIATADAIPVALAVVDERLLARRSEHLRQRFRWFSAGFCSGVTVLFLLIRWIFYGVIGSSFGG